MDSGYLPMCIMIFIFKFYFENCKRINVFNILILNKYFLSKFQLIFKCFPKIKNNYKTYYYEKKPQRNSFYKIRKFLSTKHFDYEDELSNIKLDKCKIICRTSPQFFVLQNKTILMKIVVKSSKSCNYWAISNEGQIILSSCTFINVKIDSSFVELKRIKTYNLNINAHKISLLENSITSTHYHFVQRLPCALEQFIENFESFNFSDEKVKNHFDFAISEDAGQKFDRLDKGRQKCLFDVHSGVNRVCFKVEN